MDAGLGLKTTPEEWLKVYDVSLSSEPDPLEFKEKLFMVSGYQSAPDARYVFKKSKVGFFMMALNLTPTFYIGFGPVMSLFGLSTLAHEIGHATTRRERNLEVEFLDYPETIKGNLIFSNEVDSYRYACIFMQNAFELTGSHSISPHGLKDRLIQRKAIQNNLHLLKNRMNYSFFSGLPLIEIAESYLFTWLRQSSKSSDNEINRK